MTRRITILGSTGSIGQSALKVVRAYPGAFQVVALAAHSNIEELYRQIDEFHPEHVAITDPCATHSLDPSRIGAHIHTGPDALEVLAALDADVVLCGVVGAVGLKAILAAIGSGNRIALANKEPMIMAGKLITEAAARARVRILPVDSEHSAVFQCLEGHRPEDVRTVYLTASGGPFYRKPRAELHAITPDEATNHPTWNMGAKVSIDSATLMNKGLEVIEAMWLFGLPLDKIQVVIHPQSVVHALVEFADGNILAHLGVTDMIMPIQFALTWPERVRSPLARLDLTNMKPLTFDAPDFSEFPCLRHALDAARRGGTAGAILNAANETAVAAFRGGRIPFLGIPDVVGKVMSKIPVEEDYTLDSILSVDERARRAAESVIASIAVSSA